MKIDLNVLKQIAQTYGVAPVQMIPGAAQLIQGKQSSQADDEGHQVLTSNGYTFNPADRAYHKESEFEDEDQMIYAIPETPKGPIYLWVLAGQLARILPGPEKLKKWIEGDFKYPDGKVNKFIETYMEMTGQSKGSPKSAMAKGAPEDRMAGPEPEIEDEPMSGPVPDRSDVGEPPSQADAIINKIMLGAKIKPGTKLSKQAPIRLPADEIIDLYQKAKELAKEDPEEGKKLLDFIKTLKTTPFSETIKRSQLESLIREIVKGIVKEGWQDSYVPGRDPIGGYGKSDPNEKWVEDFANKQWPDPMDIGKSGQGLKWRIIKSKKADSGEMVYQLGKTKTVHLSKFIIKRGRNWYYLEQDPETKAKKWVKMTERPPKPSAKPVEPQEPEGPPVDEMTGTAAVSPVMTPKAFGKKKMSVENARFFDSRDWSELASDPSLSSVCCGARPLGNVDSKANPPAGICSKCRNHATFEKNTEEEPLTEMTTTDGGTPGYMVPGAFSRKGGSKAGVAGSAALGYQLTKIGKQDMERQGDKILEGKSVKDGTPICKHCKKPLHYAGQIECHKCGKVQEAKTKTKTCPYCNMMAINGVWTHEQGCPNSKDV